jgi:putative PIN family toxin of toxin-antitoxin system
VKIVLDTNALVSGIFFSGPPARIVNAWLEGRVELALSSDIVDEYLRVARVLSAKYPNVAIERVLVAIMLGSVVDSCPSLDAPVCSDPDDDKFLSCAMASSSTIVISGDRQLLKCSGYGGLAVMTPRAFVEEYLR